MKRKNNRLQNAPWSDQRTSYQKPSIHHSKFSVPISGNHRSIEANAGGGSELVKVVDIQGSHVISCTENHSQSVIIYDPSFLNNFDASVLLNELESTLFDVRA